LPEGIGVFGILSTVADISKHARNVFVALVVGCVISWLTILQTTDATLLTNSSVAPLPVIQAKVPTQWFFVGAPLLLTFLFVYLHLFLQNFWIGLGRLPAVFQDGVPLDLKAFPWILTSLVRSYLPLLKIERPPRSRQFVVIAVFSGWALVPLTITWFWLRSIPLQDWYITVLHVTLVGYLASFSIDTNRSAIGELRGGRRLSGKRSALKQLAVRSLVLLVALGLCAVISLLTFKPSEGWKDQQFLSWFGLDLRYAKLSIPEAGFDDWLRVGRKGRPPVKGAELEGRSLRLADAVGAFLVAANLRFANLNGADLSWANLTNAILFGTRLRSAKLKGAKLMGADLTAADLTDADLTDADLTDADLEKANFSGANLSRVEGLTQDQLDIAFGDTETKLPAGLFIKQLD
jgi:hypothetical protein